MRPPNTTIPKTEAADPSSQYATVFKEVSGKKPCLTFSAVTGFDIVLLREANGVLIGGRPGKAAALLLNRMLLNGEALIGSFTRAVGVAYVLQ